MTQEDKELLMRDLCARLPYKTKVRKHWMYQETDGSLKEKESDGVLEINDLYAIWENKPYLRPLSSMTEEEENELDKTDKESSRIYFNDLHSRVEKYGRDNLRGFLPDYPTLDWLNAHHFDYRGLIEKGLALEAPEGMYKTK